MDSATKIAIRGYFKKEFADVILEKLKSGHRLNKFLINPFSITALASGVFGEHTSLNMAKAILYPRVLGTSVSTTFGDKMQKLCTTILGASASSTPGMDIEFDDKVINYRVIMQLKAGPNTINSGDVDPIVREMSSAYRLLLQNRSKNIPTFAIGITYGSIEDISGHYKKISSTQIGSQLEIPIFVGKDFWHRLTGDKNFYHEMIEIFIDLFEKENYSDLLQKDLDDLAQEIEEKYFTDGKFDVKKI